ncbi:MAG: phosphonate ABC transporter, permease protein PhnE [Candidatus Methylomirabilales bacterium]
MKSLSSATTQRGDSQAQASGPAVTLRGVQARYSHEGPRVLDIEELVIRRGERVAVIGPSGAGKTTLLRLINGYVQPEAGQIVVLGHEITATSIRRRDIRRRVGFVFQDFNLIERANTFQNVLWGRLGRVYPLSSLMGWFPEADKQTAMKAIVEVDLLEQASQRADTLSGGQQQRVAVARVLAQGAEIILADEPVSNLDPALADDILGLLTEVSERHGATLIMSVHQPALAQRYADRIVTLHQGRIVQDRTAGMLNGPVAQDVAERDVISIASPVSAGIAEANDTAAAVVDPPPVAATPRDAKRDRPVTGYPRPTPRDSLLRVGGILSLVALIAWAWNGADFHLEKLATGLPRMAEFFSRMIPPDTTVTKTVIVSTGETVQIALFGTMLSAVASFLLGLLAAVNLTPRWVHQPVKWLLGILRAVPMILLALLFVSAVGLGPFPGVLAVAVHSTGMLGKFYAEAFENARRGPLEALGSAGATWWQQVRFGVLTQVAPDVARDTLFRFELNLRESLVLGLVGAGGIGFYIQLYIRAFQYQKVATLTLVVLLIVVLVEQISVAIRHRLR